MFSLKLIKIGIVNTNIHTHHPPTCCRISDFEDNWLSSGKHAHLFNLYVYIVAPV